MRRLVLGLGNTLRGDDGVGARVLQLLGDSGRAADDRLEPIHGLTPELAWDISCCDEVVFVDADLRARTVTLEPVPEAPGHASTSHDWSPARLLALARELGFQGPAWVCRLPVAQCGIGEGLSPVAEAAAAEAAALLLQRGAS
jgi:hydrogenase maturation protease